MRRTKMKILLGISFLLSTEIWAQNNETFRTPAKRYDAAYSIKLSLKRAGFEYVVPVWIKPDEKESSLDQTLLADMGWTYKDLKADEVLLSNEKIEHLQFKNKKSDWAGGPKFQKPCCYGIIGQDILKDFEVRFDPNSPAHLKWSRILVREKLSPKKEKEFIEKIKPLFSIKSEMIKIGNEKYDLSHVPYTLGFTEGKLEFEKNLKR